MASDIHKCIKELYHVFAPYLLNVHVDTCPCCISSRDKAVVSRKQLNELNYDELYRYTFKAMSTWGDVDDFKHFLPRILELLTFDERSIESFIIFGNNNGVGRT